MTVSTSPPATVTTAPAPSVLNYARAYLAAGWSVIPIARNGTKSPAIDRLPLRPTPNGDKYTRTWSPYQAEIADAETLATWFADGECGIGIVGGAVSNGLCCLDIESSAVAVEFEALLHEWRMGLWALLPRVKTPGAHSTDGGIQCYFRTADLTGLPNATLARTSDWARWPTIHPSKTGKPVGLVELRHEGKYWLAPGSPADCHPLNRTYEWDRSTRKLTEAPLLDPEDVVALLGVARSLDQSPAGAAEQATPAPAGRPGGSSGVTPLDDYDRRGPSWSELLGSIGWREVGKGRWRSPDKTNAGGWSATTTCRTEGGVELLHVFSPNAAPFTCGATYGRGRAYAVIHHKGDLSAAARALAQAGYGDGGGSVPVRFGPAGSSGGTEAGGAGSGPAGSPPPGGADEGPEPWQSPIPLDTLADPVPIFPLGVFPDWLRHTVKSVAAAGPCPVDYPAAFALAIAGGMIGASISVRIKGKWTEVPSIFLCAIGVPGSGKSPALKNMMDPVFRLHREAMHRDQGPVYVSDVTTEKLAGLLKDQPRGYLLMRDELTGWMHSLDQYKAKGSGSDRQFYLSAWSGDPINQLRKNPDSPPVFVPHPCLSVIGGTQPDVVAAFRGHNDGFSDRILFVYPEQVRSEKETWATLAETDLRDWNLAVEQLHNIGMTVDGPQKPVRPWFLDLSADGKREWEKFYLWAVAQQGDPQTPDYLIEPIQKLTNYVPRLAVVLHVLAHTAPVDGEIIKVRDLPAVSGDAMFGAATLARYFYDHAARAYGAMRTDGRLRLMRKVVRWLFDKEIKQFTIRDLHRALWRNVSGSDEWPEAVKELIRTGYVRYAAPMQAKPGGWPKPAVYEVNPDLNPAGGDALDEEGNP